MLQVAPEIGFCFYFRVASSSERCAMEDGDNGESADDVTEPVFAPAGRRQSHGLQNKQGYSKCHICDARDGLRTVSQARLADAYHSMKKEMHIQLQLSK